MTGAAGVTSNRGAHLARVLRALGAASDLPLRLAALEGADLRALLLEVVSRRAAARTPADILRRYELSPQSHASPVAPALRKLEAGALALVPDGFTEVTLPPHAPLGVSSVLGRFSQDRVLSTLADTEVVSDSTNMLALECARRRRRLVGRGVQQQVRLAASHRLLRPREGAHFGLLALVSAGRDRGSFQFELDALAEHIRWHLRVIAEYAPRLALTVRLTDISGGPRRAALEHDLMEQLAPASPAVSWRLDDERQAGRAYYAQACFAIDAHQPGREPLNLVDGGLTDWTARMLSDRKERLLISGLGSERLLQLSGGVGQ
jgi:hypothetical protein